jgi:hypothetical protein
MVSASKGSPVHRCVYHLITALLGRSPPAGKIWVRLVENRAEARYDMQVVKVEEYTARPGRKLAMVPGEGALVKLGPVMSKRLWMAAEYVRGQSANVGASKALILLDRPKENS